MTDVLLFDVDGGIATLTMNRPGQRNALDAALLAALAEAFTHLRDDAAVRAIVLTGSGDRAFCAGADLGDMASAAGELERHRARGLFGDVFMAIRRVGKPVIGAVNGHALGGGFGLALCCDLLVAADEATFGTPEITVGLWPMVISAVMVRNLGRKRAMRLMLTGTRIAAATAMEWGFVNEVVARPDALATARRWAADIAAFSPLVLRLGRDSVYATEDLPFEVALQYLQSQLTVLSLSDDYKEGVKAFLEKRPPAFTGT